MFEAIGQRRRSMPPNLRFERLPAPIQFSDVVDVCRYRADRNCRQLRNQLRHRDTTLCSAPLEHRRSAVVDFYGLSFHA